MTVIPVVSSSMKENCLRSGSLQIICQLGVPHAVMHYVNPSILWFCRILRSAGLIGEVTATWRISPSDTAVFTTTSTTVVFADGESEVIVMVQVNLVILLTL